MRRTARSSPSFGQGPAPVTGTGNQHGPRPDPSPLSVPPRDPSGTHPGGHCRQHPPAGGGRGGAGSGRGAPPGRGCCRARVNWLRMRASSAEGDRAGGRAKRSWGRRWPLPGSRPGRQILHRSAKVRRVLQLCLFCYHLTHH